MCIVILNYIHVFLSKRPYIRCWKYSFLSPVRTQHQATANMCISVPLVSIFWFDNDLVVIEVRHGLVTEKS